MMIRTRHVLYFFVFFCCSVSLAAQSDNIIDDLLSREKALFGDTAYIVLVGAGMLNEDASPVDAADTVSAKGWKLRDNNAEDPIKLMDFSLLVMQAFDIDGGLLYKLFPVPRYAFRELTYLGFLPKEQNPYRYISGKEVLRLVGKTLTYTGMEPRGEK